MTEENKYEVLKSLPPYGPMYIPISEDGINDYSEGLVVRLFKSDNTSWVANFKVGWTNFNHVRSFKNSELIIIIAGGTCYLMNKNQKILTV